MKYSKVKLLDDVKGLHLMDRLTNVFLPEGGYAYIRNNREKDPTHLNIFTDTGAYVTAPVEAVEIVEPIMTYNKAALMAIATIRPMGTAMVGECALVLNDIIDECHSIELINLERISGEKLVNDCINQRYGKFDWDGHEYTPLIDGRTIELECDGHALFTSVMGTQRYLQSTQRHNLSKLIDDWQERKRNELLAK